jgi:hypothetical protein
LRAKAVVQSGAPKGTREVRGPGGAKPKDARADAEPSQPPTPGMLLLHEAHDDGGTTRREDAVGRPDAPVMERSRASREQRRMSGPPREADGTGRTRKWTIRTELNDRGQTRALRDLDQQLFGADGIGL